MENAWLDSLSEDWISQPPSDDSPAGSLPSLSSENSTSEHCGKSSRIPLSKSRKRTATKYNDSVQLPLSERSLNDNNIPPSECPLRRSSKSKRDILNGTQDPQLSRTVSLSTTGSTQHHTVKHKSLSLSPQKLKREQDAPEWKRRLLHGEVAYGEQRDLFSPAGLENIFRPPPSQILSLYRAPERFQGEDITMPSSPPPCTLGNRSQSKSSSLTDTDTKKENQLLTPKGQRTMKYQMVDTDSQHFSEDSLSRSSSFHPGLSTSQMESNVIEQSSICDQASGQPGSSLQSTAIMETASIVSGQSDVRHEDLSPIFISRHNTVDGRIDYSALDLPPAELQQRLEDVAINKLESFRSPEESSQLPRGHDTISTEELPYIGKFVNLGRGGESEDGSFQQRMLSPSSLPVADESVMLCEASVEASTPKNMPYIGRMPELDEFERQSCGSISPNMPRMPNPSPVKDENSNSRPGPGNPLKLFGTYDTFTNQKLLRRLSQFENNVVDDNVQYSLDDAKDTELVTESVNHTGMNEAYIEPSSPSKQIRESSRTMNRFGDGDLDSFEFSEGSPEPSHVMLEAVKESAAPPPQTAASHGGFTFHLQPSPALDTGISRQWRMRRINTTMKERIVTTRRAIRLTSTDLDPSSNLSVSNQLETLDTPRKRNGDSEGKRLLHSPPKNPTPKRRRTLHKTDISHAGSNGQISNSVKESHEQIQSVVGKKRKDARHGDNQEPADPQVLALRQILRPRNPTPSQRNNRDHTRAGILNSHGPGSERTRLDQQNKIAQVQAELDATAPSEASTAIGAGQPMHIDTRKGSVTTQDFLDEAKKIMAGIRGKARPSSGLVSVEESGSENGKRFPSSRQTKHDDSYEESTKEPFSRPPSREGGPLPRLSQKQQDPEVLDYLRKYEEMSDVDGIIASSLKSISQAKGLVNAASDPSRLADEAANRVSSQDLNMDQAYQSDPPNVRITEYPDLQRKRKHSNSSAPTRTTDNDAEFPSHGSIESSGPSTGRSVPTGSSRGSESKHIIAPHTVSHLIPEQLAGMIFDREKHIWVKRKVASGEKGCNDISPSEDTDDDPFGDIPDLTVDETQELSRIKAVAARKREEDRISDVQRYQKHQQVVQQSCSDDPVSTKFNPAATESQSAASSESSKLILLASSTTAQDTRLTSWSNPLDPDGQQTSGPQDTKNEPVDEVDEEISIYEGRVERKRDTPRRRNVTISFSSPLASIIPHAEDDDGLRSDLDESLDNDSALIDQSKHSRSYPAQTRSSQRTASRKSSLTRHTFLARPVSRIDEQDEESFIRRMDDEGLKRSVSLVISTPIPGRSSDHVSLVPPSSLARHSEGILQLTPLSEFTINQLDESFALEVSYVGQRRHQRSSADQKRSLSLSVKELVQRITDIEPYEPFWEHIKKIELRRKNLQTLHMLSKFCSQLEELDVSGNGIGQLDGAPGTIRNLRITHNCLSDLTSWGHLSNLQYVDISNNGLTSLEVFENLVHLRGLRADHNKIQSLKGIISLDGLISLRLRANMVQSLDFAESQLQRLTDLDLKGNSVRDVRNLQVLHSLTALNLEDNELERFAAEDGKLIWTLRYLKLGGNKLEHLDITPYPNIRLLYLDRNRLGSVTGLLKAKHLDSISLREQQKGSTIDQAVLNEAFEVRKLFLSGNLLTIFKLSIDFLNLQYLELANCGLERLPIEFGQMASNLRVLNLNFNALRDIKPLLGIVRLKKLHLAGNRLARLRKTMNVLAQFPNLTKADLRDNPLTLGFYPPLMEKRLVIHDCLDEEGDLLLTDPFTLPERDREKDFTFAGRLDMETKMRRRVYEMLMLSGCVRLKMLDGLVVDRASIVVRDNVWEALVKAELVFEIVAETHAIENEAHVSEEAAGAMEEKQEAVENDDLQEDGHSNAASEERWPGEDSFA